jgi:hypothetical protein
MKTVRGKQNSPPTSTKPAGRGVHRERTTVWCDSLPHRDDSEREHEARVSEEDFIIFGAWQDKSKQKIASAAVNN